MKYGNYPRQTETFQKNMLLSYPAQEKKRAG